MGSSGSKPVEGVTQTSPGAIDAAKVPVEEHFKKGYDAGYTAAQSDSESKAKAASKIATSRLEEVQKLREAALGGAVDGTHAQYKRAPARAVPCRAEREAVVSCYRDVSRNGDADPLRCAPLVDRYDACSNAAAADVMLGQGGEARS